MSYNFMMLCDVVCSDIVIVISLFLFFWSVVTLSHESVQALAAALNQESHSSSIAPTPDQVFARVENDSLEREKSEGLVIEGSAMTLPGEEKNTWGESKRAGL